MLPVTPSQLKEIAKAAVRTILTMAVLLVLVGLGVSVFRSISAAQEATKKLAEQETTIASLRADLATTQADLEAEKRNIKIVTEYVDRVETVRVRGETIIKEVPVYVTQEADSRCTVPNGFVWMHNAAATNATVVANSPSPPYAGASNVALSTVAGTVAYNYQQFHELREQVLSLQQFIRENSDEEPEEE